MISHIAPITVKVMTEGLLPNGDTALKPRPDPSEISITDTAAATAAPPRAAAQEIPARAMTGRISGNSRAAMVSRIRESVVTDMPRLPLNATTATAG